MLTAIRLRERNKKLGFMLRSYTTAQGTRFVAGDASLPSAVRIVSDPRDVREVIGVSQFEVFEVESEEALERKLRREMEARARTGGMPIPAQIIDAVPAAAPQVAALVAPTAIGEDEPEDVPALTAVPVFEPEWPEDEALADALPPPVPAPEPEPEPAPSKAGKPRKFGRRPQGRG